MDARATEVFLRFFFELKDPRRHNVRHQFTDILTIAILAVLCRSDDWIEVVEWAGAQQQWLKTFLDLPNGIPCADTFARIFARIDPDGFERCFCNWTRALAGACEGKIIALDGKTLRRAFAHAWDKQHALHLVSAWCVENELVLGQLAVDAKGNEITALPALLNLLDLKGATITIDAIGCQREIAQQITDQGGHYVLAVKDNQPTLHAKVKGLMDEVVLAWSKQPKMTTTTAAAAAAAAAAARDAQRHRRPRGPVKATADSVPYDFDEQTDAGHGRIETRRIWVSDQVQWLGADLLALWPSVRSMIVVESTRQDLGKRASAVDRAGETSVERRYFIASHPGPRDARRMAACVRGHWGVENKLHWRLDVSLREDESRLRKGHGAQNFSRLRRIVINKLKADPRKKSLKVKRYRCSIDRDYLLEILRT
jgi:predicted transposase YbfD/YdcC